MAEMPHMRRREGDEYFCPRCTVRWGIDEDPPGPCIENRRLIRDPRYQRIDNRRPVEPASTDIRQQIEDIWRRVNDHPSHICLVGSEAEWAFFEALLSEERS